MNTEKINEEQLRQYFRESTELQKDLSQRIMTRISAKQSPPVPVQMPGIILWGIVFLLFGALSYTMLKLDTTTFSFLKAPDVLNFQVPTLIVDPILLTASLAIMVGVWVVVIFEKRLLRG